MILPMLAKNWWLLFLRGIVAVLFGVMAFTWPAMTMVMLVILYGAYALADGIFAFTAAIAGKGIVPRWWLVIVGLVGILAGLTVFFWPGITAILLIIMIGAWSIAHGVMEIIGAIQLRKEINHEWILIFSGLLSVLFGMFVWARPGAGALALIWVLASYAILFGILMVALSLKLRKYRPTQLPHAV